MSPKTLWIRITLLITVSALLACKPSREPTQAGEPSPAPCPTLTPVAVTYNGFNLPTPRPVPTVPPDPNHPEPGPFIDLQVPPAWLIIGGKTVLATSGSNSLYRCGVLSHGDAVLPQEMGDSLATASLPASEKAVIVIGIESFKQFQATMRPWTEEPARQFLDPSAGRQLQAESKREGNAMVFTLAPAGRADDQLLAISITFPAEPGWPSDNSAIYLWRLNPALDIPSTPETPGVRIEPLVTAVVVDPTKITPPPSPTPLRGSITITLNDLQMGQILYLAVGDMFTFDASVTGPIHIDDERIVARVPDTTGVYQALTAGRTELRVTHDLCEGTPGCAAPVALFILKIVIQ